MALWQECKTILIVDDEPEALEGYRMFLSSGEQKPKRRSSRSKPAAGAASAAPAGDEFELLLAATGEEAVEKVRQKMESGGRVAAGFFDVKLGAGMDGLETVREIRKLDPEIHCVVVTAYHDRSVDDIDALFGPEFKSQWDYLNKPFNQGEIMQKARQMVSAWNAKRQVESMHKQLIKSERLSSIGQMARGIGHEFGNLLLRVMGKIDLALIEKTDVEKIHKHLAVAMEATERAGVIIRNMQTYAKAKPSFEMGDLHEPLQNTLDLAKHEFVEHSIEVDVKKGENLPQHYIDKGAISQVFLNLAINATHAMQGGGKLEISLEAHQNDDGVNGTLCTVRDTGAGIPAEILEQVFQSEFTTKGDEGSGLGLAISKEIVEAHEGRIWVKSQEGKGTEFFIWIPASQGEA